MKKTKTNVPREVTRVINAATGEVKMSKPKNIGKTIGGGSSNKTNNKGFEGFYIEIMSEI